MDIFYEVERCRYTGLPLPEEAFKYLDKKGLSHLRDTLRFTSASVDGKLLKILAGSTEDPLIYPGTFDNKGNLITRY